MKKNFGKEKYLYFVPSNFLQYLISLRTANHKLAVETGRLGKISYDQRICNKFSSNEIGDEFPTLLNCPAFSHIRNDYIPSYFVKYPSILKYQILMTKTDSNKRLWANIARLIREIFRYQSQMQMIMMMMMHYESYLSSAVSISDSSCSFTLLSRILTVLIFVGGAGPVFLVLSPG